uniref:Heparan-sulfate 6-O-sulfotransferase n=1 Tax=Petromyzon marinus TaxID=7757 RepID=A0AAJ7U1X4_PETMA|nr:heparan-sulfate 6-O-sulfotransferase 1-like [Petromyzon marinus]
MDQRLSKALLVAAAALIFFTIAYQYVCPGAGCGLLLLTPPPQAHRGGGGGGSSSSSSSSLSSLSSSSLDPYPAPDPHYVRKFHFATRDLDKTVPFDLKGDDVIVFLHIQKTGGTTFGRHLVRNIQLELPCECRAGQKKCACLRPGRRDTWLFSRFSTGWSCGLHADWTELTSCVPAVLQRKGSRLDAKRNFYYITMLRDPVSRYLSEWRHVQRGATWKTSLHMCDGRAPTPHELPSCYAGDDWAGVSLTDFMACPYNLANNRQTRMLADLSLVGCYNASFMIERRRGQILLESAKRNLRGMAFFGLTEFQRRTQFLFERTFQLRFIAPFTQYNATRAAGVDVPNATMARIRELNDMDVQLYEYARDLFLQRYQRARRLERQRQRQQERAGPRAWWFGRAEAAPAPGAASAGAADPTRGGGDISQEEEEEAEFLERQLENDFKLQQRQQLEEEEEEAAAAAAAEPALPSDGGAPDGGVGRAERQGGGGGGEGGIVAEPNAPRPANSDYSGHVQKW